ncbi:Retrovirus-related Pol polyprotein [Labeo rohita]|uniref:ribonuclease H n=1 Tax=Labeo rohita TaxID=84645 RepID=A0ABQ8L404_LABRO|nr:Retrovirus-related Pol polyprotein [Labeo rohita]
MSVFPTYIPWRCCVSPESGSLGSEFMVVSPYVEPTSVSSLCSTPFTLSSSAEERPWLQDLCLRQVKFLDIGRSREGNGDIVFFMPQLRTASEAPAAALEKLRQPAALESLSQYFDATRDSHEAPSQDKISNQHTLLQKAANPCATFSIQPPEPFNFSKPHEWERWIRCYERFRQASNLHASLQDNQINTFMCCMKNVIYERARFNMRKQGENESVDSFVTALLSLAEHCKYGPLYDELIRDRLVVSLNNLRLSEQMQLDKDLTLEKVIDMVRQTEAAKQQQSNLRGECAVRTSGFVDRVISRNKPTQSRQRDKGRPAITKLGLVTRVDDISIHTLQERYPKLCSGLGLILRPYTIKLSPGAVPFSLKTPRRIPLLLMPKVENEQQRMKHLGVISRVEEPTEWCAGIVVVPKKSGDPRICVDLTKLNESARREKYIPPSVEQTLGQLAEACLFSKLDANMGFWQIPLAEQSAKLTTFITPFGWYYFNRLPFGIASAPEHFQNHMVTEVTNGLDRVVCHMDDVLVWGGSQEEHDEVSPKEVTLNLDKCALSQRQFKFLGHIISGSGVRPDPAKTIAVQEMPEPSNISELRSFLGMVNQLGKFIPHLAEEDKPLRDLLSKKNCWFWHEAKVKAFQDLKKDLSSAPVLTLYDADKPIKVSADASSYGLGAVLLQQESDDWRPFAYASWSLTPVEQRYVQVEKETLGLTLGGQELDALPPCIQCFQVRSMRNSYKISHVPRKSFWTADTLSCAPLTAVKENMDEELMESTNIYVDNVMEHLPASLSFLDNLRELLKLDSVFKHYENVSRWVAQVWTLHKG